MGTQFTFLKTIQMSLLVVLVLACLIMASFAAEKKFQNRLEKVVRGALEKRNVEARERGDRFFNVSDNDDDDDDEQDDDDSLAKLPKNERVHHTTVNAPTLKPRSQYVAKDSDGNDVIGDLLVKRNVEARERGDRFFNVSDNDDDDDDEQDDDDSLAKLPKNERVHHTTVNAPTRKPRAQYVAKDSDGNDVIGSLLVK